MPTGLGQVLLGKEALRRLGYDPRQMLHDTRLHLTDVDFDRAEINGDLQNEIVGACIQHEEVDLTEEVQESKNQANFQKFKNKILQRSSLC